MCHAPTVLLPSIGERTPGCLPNANEHIALIDTMSKDKMLAFFLDYDGTLTPIVENPSDAKLTEEVESVSHNPFAPCAAPPFFVNITARVIFLGARRRARPREQIPNRHRQRAGACNRPSLPPPMLKGAAAADAATVRRFDECVPSALLDRLRKGFAVDAPFWEESGYASRGYFSFWLPRSGGAPANALEAYATHLLPLTGCAAEVVGFEWWVHSKAASRHLGNAHGHQLHFDTEEGLLYARSELHHPVRPRLGAKASHASC